LVSLAKDSIDLGIIVDDAEVALKFYKDTLGFEYDSIGQMDMGPRGVMHRLLCGTSLIKVRQIPDASAPKAEKGGPNGATGNRYWTISVSNMDAMAKQATDAGYAIPMGPVRAASPIDRCASQPQPLPLTPYRSCCP
jgi:predicted enzyme related to lactoylglutathione lyase